MLEQLIPPEIKNDLFYAYLFEIAKNSSLKTYLEIGSSSGHGSTHALVNGIKQKNNNDVSLFCMEISKKRIECLSQEYSDCKFVKPIRVSSQKSSNFPRLNEIEFFYKNIQTALRQFSFEEIIGWYEQDLDYLKNNQDVDLDGINAIKRNNLIDDFDFVLIDGSEFTGERDLTSVLGAKVIALDDINTFKCWNAYEILCSHCNYKLIVAERTIRNGFAIFERKF